MRYLEQFIPAFLTGGPIFIVMSGSAKYPSPIFAFGGLGAAFALSFGLLYLFRMLHSLKNELDELKKHGANDAV